MASANHSYTHVTFHDLRRGYTWMLFSTGKHGFNRNISFTFWAIQRLSAHPTIVCIFWWFWVYWGGEGFSQRISKIKRSKKIGRFNVVWKLEVEVKISWRTHVKFRLFRVYRWYSNFGIYVFALSSMRGKRFTKIYPGFLKTSDKNAQTGKLPKNHNVIVVEKKSNSGNRD